MAFVLASILWFLGWAGLFTYIVILHHPGRHPQRLGIAIVLFVVATGFGAFCLYPMMGGQLRPVVLRLHEGSVLALFGFLIVVQVALTIAWWRDRRQQPAATVAAMYRIAWVLTELAPGPIAALIFLTGLTLLRSSPETILSSQTWLLIVIAGFGFFVVDGVMGFTPIIRKSHCYWENACRDAAGRSKPAPPSRAERLQILAHVLSLPPLFAVALLHVEMPAVAALMVTDIQPRLSFLPPDFRPVVLALAVMAGTGLPVAVIRSAEISRRRRAGKPIPT